MGVGLSGKNKFGARLTKVARRGLPVDAELRLRACAPLSGLSACLGMRMRA